MNQKIYQNQSPDTDGKPFDLAAYLRGVPINKFGEAYVNQAFVEDTSRQVGQSSYLSTYIQFQSNKMLRSVPVESREGELAAALRLEADDDVHWFVSQPCGVSIKITMVNGVSRSQTVTADFLVFGKDGLEVLEIKPRSKLEDLVRQRPADWKRSGEDFRYVPLENAYRKLGIKFHVVVSDDLNKIETLNIKLLIQAAKSNVTVSEQLAAEARQALASVNFISLYDLRKRLSLTCLDPLLVLIAQGEVLGLFDEQRLVDEHSFLVTDGTLGLHAIREVLATRSLPEPMDSPLQLRGSRKGIEDALKRLAIIEKGEPRSTAYRLKARLNEGIAKGLSPLLAMLTKHHLKGNETCKRVSVVIETLTNYLRDKKSSAYFDEYAALAEDTHPHERRVDPKTFREYKNKQDPVELARDYGGNRSANLARSASDPADRSLEASRAFETAICDHTLVKHYSVLADVDGVKVTKRLWLSALRDLYSGAVLAVWLDTRQPSRIAVSCMLRQCMRSHGRLPETVRTDRGPEFRSVYMSALAAHYGFNLELKPPGYPQGGGHIESYFRVVQRQFLDRLNGNVVDIKSARSTSGSHSASKKADMPLGVMVEASLRYIDWFNRSTANLRGAAPEVDLNESLQRIACSGITASYDGDAVLATAVDVRKFKLDRLRGLHINGRHYWHPKLKDPSVKKSNIEVRLEPESADRVYAETVDGWLVCYCTNPGNSAGLSHAEKVTQAIMSSNYSAIKKQVAEKAGVKKYREIFAKIADGGFERDLVMPEDIAEEVDPFERICVDDLPSIVTTTWSGEQ